MSITGKVGKARPQLRLHLYSCLEYVNATSYNVFKVKLQGLK